MFIVCIISHDDDYKPNPSEIDYIQLYETREEAEESINKCRCRHINDYAEEHEITMKNLPKKYKKNFQKRDCSVDVKPEFINNTSILKEIIDNLLSFEYINSEYDYYIYERNI